LKSLAVFCGASKGASDCYIESAKKFGSELAKQNITLVYGGSSVGMMGAVADSVLAGGGRVIGVMPDFLDKREVTHQKLSELIIVKSMHERKARMNELTDGFVALPGGPGTLEEFFEMFTWAQLGLHRKPLGILNINHYYDPLISLFNHMADEQFLLEKYRSMALVDEHANRLIEKLKHYQPPMLNAYLHEEQT